MFPKKIAPFGVPLLLLDVFTRGNQEENKGKTGVQYFLFIFFKRH